MIKPSDKVLIGWITLVATFASTNLGRVSASELSPANPEQSGNDEAVAATQGSDIGEVDDTAVVTNAESIAPENGGQQPEFSPQSVAAEAVAAEAVAVEESLQPQESLLVAESPEQTASERRAAKLEHLVSTATKPMPAMAQADTVVVNSVDPQIESVPEPDVVVAVSPSAAARFDHLPAAVTAAQQPVQPLVQPQVESRGEKLNHLVSTATREIPTTSSLREVGGPSAASPPWYRPLQRLVLNRRL